MSITQQYLLDTHRARQHGEPAPPAPGLDDWHVVRELRDHRRFRAVLAGRPVRRRPLRSLRRWARLRSRGVSSIRPDRGAVAGGGGTSHAVQAVGEHHKAEEGVDAEPRRPTTRRRGAVPATASLA
ncbi:hypothetical protein [Streptomyces sp. MK7]|uniref:hypothetical protein n=1 Tax=Streptomyces sp. MK7 TaxID=3067635 RepID=UPI0037DA622A